METEYLLSTREKGLDIRLTPAERSDESIWRWKGSL